MLAAELLSENWIFGREAKLFWELWHLEDNISAKDIISWNITKPEGGIFIQ